MILLAFLIPGAILGLIVWVVLGFIRSRSTEPFTLATLTALYARVLTIIGLLMSLTGLGVIFKALFAFLNLAYSYYDTVIYASPAVPCFAPPCPPFSPDNSYLIQQRGSDLVLGLTLFAIGLLIALAHFYLSRSLARFPGGSPAWVSRGTLFALTITTALGAVPSAAIGLYLFLTYFILGPSQSQQPWGESLGAAIAFVPAWLFFMNRLLHSLHSAAALPPVSS